jgi:hypothetical protein
LRITVGKTVIVAQTVFFGDGKCATEYEARKDGIHWLSPKDRTGFTVTGDIIDHAGGTTSVAFGEYLTVDKLKPGSIYVTTPSIKCQFDAAPKPVLK